MERVEPRPLDPELIDPGPPCRAGRFGPAAVGTLDLGRLWQGVQRVLNKGRMSSAPARFARSRVRACGGWFNPVGSVLRGRGWVCG